MSKDNDGFFDDLDIKKARKGITQESAPRSKISSSSTRSTARARKSTSSARKSSAKILQSAPPNSNKKGSHNVKHNDRSEAPDYLIGSGAEFENEINRSAQEAAEYRYKLEQEADQAYKERTGQKTQYDKEKQDWGMVVNLDEHHTMKDVEKLAAYFNEKYGWQCYQIAIHRDEGHLVSKETGKTYRSSKKGKDKGDFKYNAKTGIYTFKNGDKYTLTELKEKFEIKINYHAHLELFTVNKQGITAFKKAQFAKKAMSQIQTEVAELLGMERGEYKSKSKRQGLGHREFKRAMQEKEKGKDEGLKLGKEQARKEMLDELSKVLTQKEKEKIISQMRFNMQGKGYQKEQFWALSALKKDKSIKTLDDINKEIEKIFKENKALRAENKELKQNINQAGNNQAISKLIGEKTALNLKVKKERQKREKYAKKGAEYRKQRNAQSSKIKELEAENKALKEQKQMPRGEKEQEYYLSYPNLLFNRKYKLGDEKHSLIKFFDQEKQEVKLHNGAKIKDDENKLTLSQGQENLSENVALMLKIAQSKGWDLEKINVNGSQAFKDEATKQIKELLEIEKQENALKTQKDTLDNKNIEKENKSDLRGNFDDENRQRIEILKNQMDNRIKRLEKDESLQRTNSNPNGYLKDTERILNSLKSQYTPEQIKHIQSLMQKHRKILDNSKAQTQSPKNQHLKQ